MNSLKKLDPNGVAQSFGLWHPFRVQMAWGLFSRGSASTLHPWLSCLPPLGEDTTNVKELRDLHIEEPDINANSHSPLTMTPLFRKILPLILCLFSFSPLLAAEEPLGRLNWDAWRTLPVYDDGRIMPLNTFARILVTQICGTTSPKIAVDDILLSNIESELEDRYKYDPKFAAEEASRIRKRIDELFPQGERTFEAHELLFAWLVEPEVWDFIPFLTHKKAREFRAEILSVSRINQRGRPIRFVAPIQLETSRGYNDLLQRVHERQMEATRQYREGGLAVPQDNVPLSAFETIAVDLHNTLSVYRVLVFKSERTLREFPSSFALAIQNAQKGFSTASQSWARLAKQGVDRFLPKHEIALPERFNALALLLDQLNRHIHEQESSIILLSKIELQLDAILKLTDGTIADCDEIYRILYSETNSQTPLSFNNRSVEIREDAITLHSALHLLRRSTQAACLSLYQSGRTVRVLPALYDDVLKSDVASSAGFELPDSSPWISLNLVLRAGPTTIRRFVDRDYPWDPEQQQAALSELFDSELYSSLSQPMRDSLHKPTVFTSDSTQRKIATENLPKEKTSTEMIRTAFQEFSTAFIGESEPSTEYSPHEPAFSAENDLAVNLSLDPALSLSLDASPSPMLSLNGTTQEEPQSASIQSANETNPKDAVPQGTRSERWNGAMLWFTDAIRQTAMQMEPIRKELNPVEQSDPGILLKTAYPAPGSLDIEYLYSRFNPFYWMGITAGIGFVLLALSAVLELCRRTKNQATDNKSKTTRSDSETSQKPKAKTSPTPMNIKDRLNSGLEMSLDAMLDPGKSSSETHVRDPNDMIRLAEEFFLWTGILTVFVSILITFAGGVLRACISGWAPVSNMFETIVLMAFIAACLGIWFTLQPLLAPALSRSWRLSAFPWTLWHKSIIERKNRQKTASTSHPPYVSGIEGEIPYGLNQTLYGETPGEIKEPAHDSIKVFARTMLALLRFVFIVLTLLIVLYVSYYEYSDEQQGLFAAMVHSFAMNDPIDWIVVFVSVCSIVWFVPRFIIACILFPFILFFPSRLKHLPAEDVADSTLVQGIQGTPPPSSPPIPIASVPSTLTPENVESLLGGPYKHVSHSDGSFWWYQARNHILHRKMFILAGALIVCIAAIVTQINPREFNPNIRPLAAVLRSNFWLAVHVIAIVVSYASGLIAWLLALASLSMYIFGHYRKFKSGKHGIIVVPPHFCDTLAPYIRKMLRVAVWMLMIGTILGARWADYSWGRFWSWDVKEVWALITLLVFLFVLHGRKARFYGEFGITIGAVFGAIAIVMTWYGFNFVFNMGRHAYGHGDSSWATNFLLGFIIVNLLWCMIAVFRYMLEFGERRQAGAGKTK